MKTPLIIFLSVLLLLFSCNNTRGKSQEENTISEVDTIQQDTTNVEYQMEKTLRSIPKDIKSVFGYRFSITGDFDGDGRKEKLTEHYFSALDNKETNKFYEGLTEYGQLVTLTLKKEPYSFVLSDNKSIDSLRISSDGQQLGLSYLKNEGDLNGDGTDEISYVLNWADWSNLNTWYVMTYKHNKWQELYSFPIWDWQLPDLPETFNQYGLFGLDNKIINTTDDTVNKMIEKELYDFKGLLRKIRTNKIQVIFRNEEAEEDTMMVDLKRLK